MHVTNKAWIHFLGPDNQHHSESSVNIVFLEINKQPRPIHYEWVCIYVHELCMYMKTLAKEPFRQKDGLKADTYATCRIIFTFMSAVVLETAVSTIYSASSYYLAPREIRRILSCSSVCDFLNNT